jgi:hypothetical protein
VNYVPNYKPIKPRPTLAYLATQRLLAKPEVADCLYCHEPGSHADALACRRALDTALLTYRIKPLPGSRDRRVR